MRLLGLAHRVLSALPAMAAYRIVHSFPAALQGLAASVAGSGECPEAPVRPPGLGVEVANPVGLAAGLNKDGNLTWLGDALCLGFTVVGSVLPRPHPGARRKLLLRLTPESAVNRLGLPSRGVARAVAAVRGYRPGFTLPVFNIAGLRPGDYPEAAGALRGVSPWLEVNVSCPNTEEHGTFESLEWAERLLREAARAFGGPVLLKVPSTRDRDLLVEYAWAARRAGAAGVVAGNTSKIVVRGVQAGLSGASIYWSTRFMVRVLAEELPSSMALVAVGGVTRPERAVELLELGASLVEVLTVLLRLGPGRVLEIVESAARWASRR